MFDDVLRWAALVLPDDAEPFGALDHGLDARILVPFDDHEPRPVGVGMFVLLHRQLDSLGAPWVAALTQESLQLGAGHAEPSVERANLFVHVPEQQLVLGNPLLAFIDSCLRGIGQVCFMNNPVTGLAILVAMFVAQAWLGFAGALGLVASTATAAAIGMDRGAIRAGLFGFNAVLVGAGLSLFLQPDWDALVMVWIVLGAFFSTVLHAALANVFLGAWKVPPFTLAFNFMTLLFLIGALNFANGRVGGLVAPAEAQVTGGSVSNTLRSAADAASANNIEGIFNAVFRGIGQLFFANSVWAGIIIIVGIAACSRIAAGFALVGSFLIGPTGLALGANDYVARPFAPEELRARVDAVIRMRRAAQVASRERSRLATINQLGRTLFRSGTDVAQILHVLVGTLTESLCDGCSVLLLPGELPEVFVSHHKGDARGEAIASISTVADPAIHSFASNEEARATLPPAYHAYIDRFGLRGLAILPFPILSPVQGVVTITRDGGSEPFDSDDLAMIETCIEYAALGVQKAVRYETERTARDQLNAVLENLPVGIITTNQTGAISGRPSDAR